MLSLFIFCIRKRIKWAYVDFDLQYLSKCGFETISMNKQNLAAKDFWAQMFDSAVKLPDAAIDKSNPKLDRHNKEGVAKALAEAGWDSKEIKDRIAVHRKLELVPNTNSPGVAPGLEAILKHLSCPISDAIAATGATNHKKVELAIDPKVGVAASLINVIMTDEAILTVSSFLFRWCGLIARAYTRTLLVDVNYWAGPATSINEDRLFLLKRPKIARYWSSILTSFAATGTHLTVAYQPCTKEEVYLMEQVAHSMEYFTIAHEYGHHMLNHRSVSADSIEQEYAADRFALQICAMLIHEPFKTIENPYLRTGAGGSLMLRALAILNSINNGISPNKMLDTHPPTRDRIQKITNRHVMQPEQFEMDLDFNGTVNRIMDAVEHYMKDFLDFGGRKLIARMKNPVEQF